MQLPQKGLKREPLGGMKLRIDIEETDKRMKIINIKTRQKIKMAWEGGCKTNQRQLAFMVSR